MIIKFFYDLDPISKTTFFLAISLLGTELVGCSAPVADLQQERLKVQETKAALDRANQQVASLQSEVDRLKAQLPSTPITEMGEYSLYDGKLKVRVDQKDGTRFFEVKQNEEASLSLVKNGDSQFKEEESKWMVYAESSRRVWLLWADLSGRGAWHEFWWENGKGTTFSRSVTFESLENVKQKIPKAMRLAFFEDEAKSSAP